MKREITTVLLILQIIGLCYAQNLVPNGSFENFKKIPVTMVRNFSEYVHDWSRPTSGSPDYFSELSKGQTSVPVQKIEFSYTDSSIQNAYDGRAFVGFTHILSDSGNLHFAEYLQVKLDEPLKKYHKYRFNSFFNLLDISKYKGIQFGFILSKIRDTSYREVTLGTNTLFETEISDYYRLEASSEIGYIDWTSLNKVVKSTGDELWLTIGSFDYSRKYDQISRTDVDYYDGAGKFAYYFIDDVSLVEVPTLVGPDTVCAGEELELYSSFYGQRCEWYADVERSVVLSTDTFYRYKPQKVNGTT